MKRTFTALNRNEERKRTPRVSILTSNINAISKRCPAAEKTYFWIGASQDYPRKLKERRRRRRRGERW